MTIKIDYVSDIACPWCAVGLGGLEIALKNIGDEIPVEIHFQPFELNPDMPPGGQEVFEHLTQKYGKTKDQVRVTQDSIKARAAEVGFPFHPEGRKHVYNTFDAHRLLHWAEEEGEGRQLALKDALFKAYFTDGDSPGSHDVLARVAGEVGLDVARAKAILASDEYADAVREREQFYLQQGIHSVPAIIINDKHLISGGQPAEVFEQALRQIAAAG